MRSLVDVLEDATRRSAFEVIFGSEHAAVFTTPWGRELARQVAPGPELFDMLSAVISSEQQIELAVGNPVELELELETTRWVLRAKSGREGISIRANCPELAASAAAQQDTDAPLARRTHPSSAAALLTDLDEGSETSGVPFGDCWGDEDSAPTASATDEEAHEDDGSPVFIAATDSTIQGLPDSSEALPEDAVVLIPEAWVQAGEQLASERAQAAEEAAEAADEGDDEHADEDADADADESEAVEARSTEPSARWIAAEPKAAPKLRTRVAEQAKTIAALQAELAQYKRTFARHDKAIRQLHKRLSVVERAGESTGEDAD